MSWIKSSQAKQDGNKKYFVFIHKSLFPKELHPKQQIGKEDFEQWEVVANSRIEAANKVWNKEGERLLSLMGPRKTKLPRKISLFVSQHTPHGEVKAGRLDPILVYTDPV